MSLHSRQTVANNFNEKHCTQERKRAFKYWAWVCTTNLQEDIVMSAIHSCREKDYNLEALGVLQSEKSQLTIQTILKIDQNALSMRYRDTDILQH